MKLFVKAKPSAREDKVEKISDNTFIVAVKEPPMDGRANSAIVSAIAEFFNVPKSRVRIVAGLASRQKIIEVV